MGEFGLGPEVKRIIAANLATMDHVDVLLLLCKAAPASVAASFAILAVQRVALALTEDIQANAVWLYSLRLVAFLLILAAIMEKNRSRPRA